MKPCTSRRESVALLACGVCPADQAADLRHHLHSCAGCREYFGQLSTVCDEHAAAAVELPEARVPSRLSSRVGSGIRAGWEPRPPETQPGVFVGWGRIAGLAMLLTLLVGGAIRLYEPHRPSPALDMTEVPQPPAAARAAGASMAGNSLAAYRLALNHSPEALAELLSKEAARPTPNPQVALRVGLNLQELDL